MPRSPRSVPAPQRFERHRSRLVVLGLLLTVLACLGLCVAAIVAPAPAPIAPLVAAVCVGGPTFSAWEVPRALASLRAERTGASALSELRRSLDELPEAEHPLGL